MKETHILLDDKLSTFFGGCNPYRVFLPGGTENDDSLGSLKEELYSRLEQGEKNFLVDLEKKDDMSVGELILLIDFKRELSRRDGRLGLVSTGPKIDFALRYNRFDRILPIIG